MGRSGAEEAKLHHYRVCAHSPASSAEIPVMMGCSLPKEGMAQHFVAGHGTHCFSQFSRQFPPAIDHPLPNNVQSMH